MDGETRITGIILEEAIRIHKKYGPGLLESAYERLLAHALDKRGLRVRRQVPVPLIDDGLIIEMAFRADLVVEECVVVESKSTRANDPADESQLLSHVRLLDHRVGLVINFGQTVLTKGVKRVIDSHRIIPTPPAPSHRSSSPRPSAPPRPPREQL
jgi:GxxExxY protein